MLCCSSYFTAQCGVMLFSKGSLPITEGFLSKTVCVFLPIDVFWVQLVGDLLTKIEMTCEAVVLLCTWLHKWQGTFLEILIKRSFIYLHEKLLSL